MVVRSVAMVAFGCLQAANNGHKKSQITSLDDLIEHIKSINDSECKRPNMSYLEYMEKHYTFDGHTGLHNMEDSYYNKELKPWCQALINLFYGRPFTSEVTKLCKKDEVNDFSHVVQCLMALDDAEWRPVALVAMRKAQQAREGTHKVVHNLLCLLMCDRMSCKAFQLTRQHRQQRKSASGVQWCQTSAMPHCTCSALVTV